MINFKVKVRLGEYDINNCLWFYIDRQKIRPFFGDSEYVEYSQHIREGVHRLTWSFESSVDDPEAGVWLDE